MSWFAPRRNLPLLRLIALLALCMVVVAEHAAETGGEKKRNLRRVGSNSGEFQGQMPAVDLKDAPSSTANDEESTDATPEVVNDNRELSYYPHGKGLFRKGGYGGGGYGGARKYGGGYGGAPKYGGGYGGPQKYGGGGGKYKGRYKPSSRSYSSGGGRKGYYGRRSYHGRGGYHGGYHHRGSYSPKKRSYSPKKRSYSPRTHSYSRSGGKKYHGGRGYYGGGWGGW